MPKYLMYHCGLGDTFLNDKACFGANERLLLKTNLMSSLGDGVIVDDQFKFNRLTTTASFIDSHATPMAKD